MYLNKVLLIGNLTRDPSLKKLEGGTSVCSFSIATNRVWKDKNSQEKKEAVDFHNIVVFGRQAEATAQYLTKGSKLMVEGRLQTRSWDGKEGFKKYTTEIIADNIQFGPKKKDGETESKWNPKPPADDGAPQYERTPQEQLDFEYPTEEANPDNIPF
jgi:single-strand DNA-binding protein